MPKIIIAGGRDFSDYALMRQSISKYLGKAIVNHALNKEELEFVSGHAPGADRLGERYVQESRAAYGVDGGYSVKIFEADWNTHGKAAGPMRNQLMAEYADGLLAFWDGQSRGTADMISRAKKMGLDVKIIRYGNEGIAHNCKTR